MLLKDLIFKYYPDFSIGDKIHRKSNIKPYSPKELCIYYSDDLGLILIPKNQINEKNELILPTNADLLVKYNYNIIADIEVNLLSLIKLNKFEIINENNLANFFYNFFKNN